MPRLRVGERGARGRHRAIGIVAAVLAAPSLLVGPLPLRDTLVLVPLLVGGHLAAAWWLLGGRPRDARADVRFTVAAIAVIVAALLVLAALHAGEGDPLFAAVYGGIAAIGAAAAAFALGFARFVARVPEVLRGDERARVVALGRVSVDGAIQGVGLIATDTGLVVAARRGLRPERHEEAPFRDLAEVEIETPRAAGLVRAVGAGGALLVTDIPLGQLNALTGYLRTRLRPA